MKKSLCKRKRAVTCLFVLYHSLRCIVIFNNFDTLEFWNIYVWIFWTFTLLFLLPKVFKPKNTIPVRASAYSKR